MPGRSLETVWVGLSAGGMVMTPRIWEDFVIWTTPEGGDEALGLVEFSIFRWPVGLSGPAYAIDDETASKSSTAPSKSSPRGTWKLFT
jgi:dipeptidase E